MSVGKLQKWTHEVGSYDLQVGDVIVEYRYDSTGRWDIPLEQGGWDIGKVIGTSPNREWHSSNPKLGLIHKEYGPSSTYQWRVVRGTTWNMEVEKIDLRVGDVILEYYDYYKKWMRPSGVAGWSVDSITGVAPNREWRSDRDGLITRENANSTTRYRISRRTAQGSETAKATTVSMWNGVCPRCGKGTYLGAGVFPTDHEGGPCAKA